MPSNTFEQYNSEIIDKTIAKKEDKELLLDIQTSNKDKINELDIKTNELKSKLRVFQPKLLDHLKSKCSDEYNWVKNHSSYFQNTNLEVKSDLNSQQKTEVKDNMTILSNCISKNNFNMTGAYNTANLEYEEHLKNSELCNRKCILLDDKNGNTENNRTKFKTCLDDCFGVYLNNVQKTMMYMNKEIELAEKNLL